MRGLTPENDPREETVDKTNKKSERTKEVIDTVKDVMDAIENPLEALGEFTSKRTGKKMCDDKFVASGFKSGCACCIITYKSWKTLHGGADPTQQWRVWNTSLYNKTCEDHLKEIEEARKQREAHRKKLGITTPEETIGAMPNDNEIDVEFTNEYINY